MNSVSANTEELKRADDFIESFAEDLQEEQKLANEQYMHCFNENGEVVFNNVTEDDILHNEYLYKYVMILSDETEINSYITELKQVAKRYKLTTEFNCKMNTYKRQAVKKLREAEREKANQAFIKRAESFPEWWDGQNIDEDVFCKGILEKHEIKCINGLLYDVDGRLDENAVESDIYSKIKYYCKKDIAVRANKILKALKLRTFSPQPPVDINTIHLQNGTLKTNGEFTNEKFFCMNRLNVNMPSEYRKPELWLKFVNELLYEEDIPTLQEYMGYCFIPCTKGQVMLFIVGNGEEGKSRVGLIMSEILGQKNVSTLKLKALVNDNYSAEMLDGKLLSIDDDITGDKLSDTSKLKEIVTTEGNFNINPKGRKAYETRIYSRLLAFGNNCLSALYDHSDGFYRRQIILRAKPKPPDRVKDGMLIEKLYAEKEQIFLWCFQGLQRLIANGFNFTVSERTKQNLEENKRESCNIIGFMENQYGFCYDENAEIPTKSLYSLYCWWCTNNEMDSLSSRTFTTFLRNNSKKYKITYSENVKNFDGNRVRGFKGIRYTHTQRSI